MHDTSELFQRTERSCSKSLSQRHTWLTAPSCVTSCIFGLRTLWSYDPFWFSVKNMTLVNLSWDLFVHLLCLLHFLSSLKGSSDMKQGNATSFPCDQIIIPVPPSDLLSLSYFISHQWVRIWLSTKSCHCVHKRTFLHVPQVPLPSCLSFPALCVSYHKHISFTKFNCHHNVFIFWQVWGIAQDEFHPASVLCFACSKDYRRKVSTVLSLLLRPKPRFAIFEIQDKPFMFKLLLLILGAVPVALFLIWRIISVGYYWMQPRGLYFPSDTFSRAWP